MSAAQSRLATLDIQGRHMRYHSLPALAAGIGGSLHSLPFSHRILLENLLRSGASEPVLRALLAWPMGGASGIEISFRPARVLMQDFTGVPAIFDLAALLGVRAVIAQSFERIHRSNLVGMGVLPLEFAPGLTRHMLALDGSEQFSIEDPQDIQDLTASELVVTRTDGREERYPVRVRIDTAEEMQWYRAGGILPYVLHQLVP